MFSTLASARRATGISLDSQFFYTPPVAAGPKPTSHSFRAQETDSSTTTSRVPSHPPVSQDVHDLRSGEAGRSQVEAIVIPSDDEFNLDSRSDTSFESLGGLLSEARNTVQPDCISGTGKGDDHNAPDASVTRGLGSDDITVPETDATSLAECEATHHDHGMQHSSPAIEKPCGTTDSSICTPTIPGDENTGELEPADAEPRLQQSQSLSRGASGHGVDAQQRSGSCSLSQRRDHYDNDRTTSQEHPYPFTPDDRGETMACSLTLPDDESTSELESADAELNPADAEPISPRQRSGGSHLSHPSQHRSHRDDGDRTVPKSDWPKPAADLYRRSPHSAASSYASGPGLETQRWSDTSVQDDGGQQNEGVIAPSQVQEIQASIPRLSVEGSNAPEPAYAELSMQPSASPDQANGPSDREGYGAAAVSVGEHGQNNHVSQPQRKRRGIRTSSPLTACRTTPEPQTRLHRVGLAQRRTTQYPKPRRGQCPSDVPEDQGQQRDDGSVAPPRAQEVQPPASQVGAKRQHNLGRHRHCSTDDGEDYSPSDTQHSEDEALRPPRRKRRRESAATHAAGGTAPQQPTCPDRSDSSREARRPARRPRRQPGATHPSSSQESTLERDAEADGTPAATFQEWPLENAVLQRVIMDGSPPTFNIQFTWGLCAEHRAGHRKTESRVAVFSAERRRPRRQKSKWITKDKGKPTSTSNRAKYTPADDAKNLRLKTQGLSWPAIAADSRGAVLGLFR